MTALFGPAALVAAALIALLPNIGRRSQRTIANLEADLLAKLDDGSESAKLLREVIDQRIAGWHRVMVKPRRLAAEPPSEGDDDQAEDENHLNANVELVPDDETYIVYPPDRSRHFAESLRVLFPPRTEPLWIVTNAISISLGLLGLSLIAVTVWGALTGNLSDLLDP